MRDPAAISRTWEVAVGLLLAGAAAGLFLAVPNLVSGWAFAMPGTTDNALQPSFFPRVVLVLLGCASLGVVLTTSSRKTAIPLAQTSGSEWRQLLRVLIVVLAYFLLIPLLGFWVSSMLFIPGITIAVGFTRPFLTAAVALIFPSCTYLVFRFAMSVMLPMGIFG